MLTPLPLYIDDTSPLSAHKRMHILSDSDDSQLRLFHPLLASTSSSFVDLSHNTNDPLFPAENAYDRLFPLLLSCSPWKVTPELLFGICRILEEINPVSRTTSSDPSRHTLVPVLVKMRFWRRTEEKSLQRLASDLAGLVDVELSAPYTDNINGNLNVAKPKTSHKNGETEDKENTSAHGDASHRHSRTMKTQKRTQRTSSLNDLIGESAPSFSRRCVACAALRSALKSGADLQNVRRALHHTHDYDGLAFPRPAPPASALLSRSRSKPQMPLASKLGKSHPKMQATSSRPRAVLASLNGEIRPYFPITDDMESSTPPSRILLDNEADFSLSEVWIKRRSQEEGWRP